jgi:hypothetical protein
MCKPEFNLVGVATQHVASGNCMGTFWQITPLINSFRTKKSAESTRLLWTMIVIAPAQKAGSFGVFPQIERKTYKIIRLDILHGIG